jgi:tRNA (guanine-N7-)-methyltransferase
MGADVTNDSTHELRSFGRRRGRKASDRQQALKLETLPRVAVDFTAPAPHGPGQVFLEIGFGGGEHLLWQARHNLSATLIGCEPFEDGVVKVLKAIDEQKLGNIRLHMGDARDVLRWLAPQSISRAFILFPDPWPKRKHRKRRLVNPATLALLARVIKPGGELRIGTDIGDYARTMLEAFRGQEAFAWQAQSPLDWRIRPDDWPPTRYEQKAEREGRCRYYFRFLRTKF